MELPETIFSAPFSAPTADDRQPTFWDTAAVHALLTEAGAEQTQRSTERLLEKSTRLPTSLKLEDVRDEQGRAGSLRAGLEPPAA